MGIDMSGLTKQVPLWSFLLTVIVGFGGVATVWGQSRQELQSLRGEVQESKAQFLRVIDRLDRISEDLYEIKGKVNK